MGANPLSYMSDTVGVFTKIDIFVSVFKFYGYKCRSCRQKTMFRFIIPLLFCFGRRKVDKGFVCDCLSRIEQKFDG